MTFPYVRLRLPEDLHTHSTHCMAIILETRFQFPHCVMKNVLFPKAITIFILIYLVWFKMEQTLDLALLASRRLPFRHVFSASFRELCYLDCKTVRIFAYSSTHEHAKQKVWNETENRERCGRVRLARFARIRLLLHALPISLLILRKKPTFLQSMCYLAETISSAIQDTLNAS